MKRKSLRLVLMLLVTLSILACAFTAFVYATEGAGVEKPERALYYNLNNGMFQLEWDAVPDCNSYRIYQNGKCGTYIFIV